MEITLAEETMALSWEPFSGDEDDRRVLSDRFTTARKDYECSMCLGPVRRGERQRAWRAVFEGEPPITHRFCVGCCKAMAFEEGVLCGQVEGEFQDDIFPTEARYEMGAAEQARRRPQP